MNGTADASAKDDGGATAESDADCATSASAMKTATAHAFCSTKGSFAHVSATNGGFAEGSDTGAPTCTPGGGTAKVRSTGGNCG